MSTKCDHAPTVSQLRCPCGLSTVDATVAWPQQVIDLERQLAKAQKTIEKLQRGVRCKQPNCPNPKADRGYCHHHRYLKWD